MKRGRARIQKLKILLSIKKHHNLATRKNLHAILLKVRILKTKRPQLHLILSQQNKKKEKKRNRRRKSQSS